VWWNPPFRNDIDVLTAVDHDADGNVDISFHDNNTFAAGNVAVLYGRAGALPDTADVEWLWLKEANGYYSVFTDVTGDRIPEFVTCGGQTARVYLGQKGQRLTEQYGSGNDAPRPGQQQWWGKPWAEVWQPNRINSNWFGDNGTLLDFGDGDGDRVNDIWTFSWPYLLLYRGGDRLDSLVDALVDIRGDMVYDWTVLGDIDSSGVPTLAFSAGNGIRYIKPSAEVPRTGIYRRLPEGTGPASVTTPTHRQEVELESLNLHAAPNPARGEVLLRWDSSQMHGDATITMTTTLGERIATYSTNARSGAFLWHTGSIAPGTYYISLFTTTIGSTTTVVLH
jgi:hypothetical protein